MEHPKPKKSLGQNFLIDPAVVEAIVSAAAIAPGTRVLEIGPGTGALTAALLEAGAEVLAVEVDPRMAAEVRRRFDDHERLRLVEADVLGIDLAAFLWTDGGPYRVVANLPYYITAPILRRLLALNPQPEGLVLMVQKEVGERLSAPAGNTSLLSIMAQYYADVRLCFLVPKEAFSPAPKVDSAVVALRPKLAYDAEKDRALFRIVKAGFAARRKTLANNLATLLPFSKAEIGALLESELGLRQDIRAQALTVDDWVRLEMLLSEKAVS